MGGETVYTLLSNRVNTSSHLGENIKHYLRLIGRDRLQRSRCDAHGWGARPPTEIQNLLRTQHNDTSLRNTRENIIIKL